ncbi:MAG: dethiobiotin synthase [Myxococcota bacterium]|jgi:dethiobiotin synthetase|nr:dethiobiotin synthase [Myxococcota bacterium]
MTLSIFVTGNGTEVGKTVVTRALARAAKRRGLKVVALKPVESGAVLEEGQWRGADAMAIAKAASLDVGKCPNNVYCLRDPVSPHLAAQRQNVTIEPREILALLERYRESHDLLLAEGAGGLLVPLGDDVLQADVYAQAGFDAIVVAKDELGAINATLLTLEALRRRGIKTRGVILNRSRGDDWGNWTAIERHGKTPVLGALPELFQADDEELADLAESSLRLEEIFSLV